MFNESQKVAISHKTGPAIVLAGPGSGKTTVITHRIKNLIEKEKVSPDKIMVVTFTKAAATQMQRRFQDIMNEGCNIPRTYAVIFGTFHSIYYRILKSACNYKSDDILSERQKLEYIREITIRIRMDVSSLQDFIHNAAGEISRIKGNMLDIDRFSSGICDEKKFRQLYREYEKSLEAEGKIDFDDMLIKCYQLLQKRGDVLKMWQQRFQYILIDEFQDINFVQYQIVKQLAIPENNIFIVGDDDQSIYGFRGACPQIMFQFQKDFPDAREILLGINYRSSPKIVSLSENLIVHNKNRFHKKLVSAKHEGALPDIRQFRNQGEELKYMSAEIKKYMRRGIQPYEIAILVRNNSQISHIRQFLGNEMLKTSSAKTKDSVYDGMVARDILAYVKAAVQMNDCQLCDNADFIYILNKPTRYISRQIIGREGMDFEQLKQVYAHSQEILTNIEDLQFHLQMIAKLNPASALTYIRNGTGYEKYLQQYAIEKQIKPVGLLDQFDKIQQEAAGFETIEDWLRFVEGKRSGKDNEMEEGGIHIMTMHGSKGLEFRVVFIVDANQGIIPSARAVREGDLEEERRVFYVAMTRAAEFLGIYGVMEHLGCPAEMSIFVGESFENS